MSVLFPLLKLDKVRPWFFIKEEFFFLLSFVTGPVHFVHCIFLLM